jgi:hypothetical protein
LKKYDSPFIIYLQTSANAEYSRKEKIHMQNLTDNFKLGLAKSITELAIQNDLFIRSDDPTEMAKDITTFFKTVFETADSDTN